MLALDELKADKGLTFDMAYSRRPFFLRPGEECVRNFLANAGVPRNATREEAFPKCFGPHVIPKMNNLFKQAGLEAYWGSGFSDTMDSHRLAWYASIVSAEKGELFWGATSRRFFEGKDTKIRGTINLDNHEMLMECAEEVGLDLKESQRVLSSDMYRDEIWDVVHQMQAAGINSIPVLVFEVDGVVQDSWLTMRDCKGRVIHHGSGNKAEFSSVLQQLHADCSSAQQLHADCSSAL